MSGRRLSCRRPGLLLVIPHKTAAILVREKTQKDKADGLEQTVRPDIPLVKVSPWKALLQIAFKGIQHSDAIEARIKEEVTKLEQFCDRITKARAIIASWPLAHGESRALSGGSRFPQVSRRCRLRGRPPRARQL